MSGHLIGIARKARRKAPVEELVAVAITIGGGLDGDSRGRFVTRAVSVLSLEGWRAALAALSDPVPDLPWTIRRANLLVAGVALPRAPGGRLEVGGVELEVTGETTPCSRMEAQVPGLMKALSPDWRGGVTCRVLRGGLVAVGDAVTVTVSPPEKKRVRLPG